MKENTSYNNKPSVYYNKYRKKYICDYKVKNTETGEVSRKRRSFETKKKAEAFQRSILNQLKKEPNKLLDAAGLTKTQTLGLINLQSLIDKTGLSPSDLERLILPYVRGAALTPISVKDAVNQFLKTKKEHWADDTYAGERARLNRFARFVRAKMLTDITSEVLLEFLGTETPGMRKKFLVILSSFLKFYSDQYVPKQCYLPNNIMEYVRASLHSTGDPAVRKSNGRRTPTCLSIEEVRKGLRNGIGFTINGKRHLEFLGTVVFGVFLGLRPSEVWNLFQHPDPWNSCFDWERNVLMINDDIAAKDTGHREIQIRPNVMEWLHFLRDFGFPICFNRKSQPARKNHSLFRNAYLGDKSKMKEWNDVDRHTFGTMLYNSKDLENSETRVIESEVTRQMGNSAKVFMKHYKSILRNGDTAEEFWSIVPTDFGQFTPEGFVLFEEAKAS